MKLPAPQPVHASLLWVTVIMILIGCPTNTPAEPRMVTTSPVPVDEATDNSVLQSMLVPGLVVGLDIEGEQVSATFVRIMMIPKLSIRREESEFITLTALRGGKVLATVRVPDSRLMVREGFGETEGALLTLERRTATAAIPLPARIDRLEIRLPGNREPVRQDLREMFDQHCASSRQSMLC